MDGNEKKLTMQRELQGVVTSNKMHKTITVEVTRTVRHSKYNKFLKKHARYHAHDEANACSEGDVVLIAESKPLSKTKRWVLKNIVERVAV